MGNNHLEVIQMIQIMMDHGKQINQKQHHKKKQKYLEEDQRQNHHQVILLWISLLLTQVLIKFNPNQVQVVECNHQLKIRLEVVVCSLLLCNHQCINLNNHSNHQCIIHKWEWAWVNSLWVVWEWANSQWVAWEWANSQWVAWEWVNNQWEVWEWE